MDLELTEQQKLLKKEARELLDRECPPALVRQLREPASSGHPDGLWETLAELGWIGLALPEEHGGGGATFCELGLLFEEAGRVLFPRTLQSTVHVAILLEALGTPEQKRSLLPRIAAGQSISSVALAEPHALREPEALTTSVRWAGDRWLLEGEKTFVSNAHLADPLLVVARTAPPDGLGITVIAVPLGQPGVVIEPHVTFGGDRQSKVLFEGVELDDHAAIGGPEGIDRAWPVVHATNLSATALQCMDMVGGSEKVVEMTVDHVKAREQFGRPIAAFQAVQHHIANMAINLEGARQTARQAVWRLSSGLPADREVAIAKAWCSDVYSGVTVLAHQLHGGYGIVVEHDLHLYSERAKAMQISFGPRDEQLRILGGEMGVGPW